MPHRMLTLDEVAEFLHIQAKDVERLVVQREIPCKHKGDRVFFHKREIEAWASQRVLGLSEKQLGDFHRTSSAKSHDLSKGHAIIPELMQHAHIQPAVTAKTKASIIRDMVGLADSTGLLMHADDLLDAVEGRERMCATALAGGLALLHPVHHEPYMFEDSFVVLGKTVQAVPFGSPDGATTDLFFLICSQDNRIHLHVLARLCMLCHHTSLLLDLREAGGAEEMYARLVGAEEELIKAL